MTVQEQFDAPESKRKVIDELLYHYEGEVARYPEFRDEYQPVISELLAERRAIDERSQRYRELSE